MERGTASITGAYVALCDAIRVARREKWIRQSPILDEVAAVSVGLVQNRAVLDLDYAEDAAAQVDMNVVMTGAGRFIEVQGTGEGATFGRSDLDRMLRLGARGIGELVRMQRAALRKRVKQ